jgi:hypothetical protein
MSAKFDIRPVVREHSALPENRLRILDSFGDVGMAAMRRGVIFVFAAWSGPAVVGLRKFTKSMAMLPTNMLDLVVLDIDCLASDDALQLFGDSGFRANGSGEVIWVRDGLAVAREMAFCTDDQVLFEHTRKLVESDPS